jgi:hypothetical protein
MGDTIKINLMEIEFMGMDWVYLAQDRDRWRAHVKTVMALWLNENLVILE